MIDLLEPPEMEEGVLEVEAPEEKKEKEPQDKRPNARPACQSPKKTNKKAKHTTPVNVSIMETTHVLVEPDSSFTLEEELLLIGAIEKLAYQYPKLRLQYKSQRISVSDLVAGAWFFNTPWDWKAFGNIAEIQIPTPEVAYKEQEDRYREQHVKKTNEMQFQQDLAYSQGMKDYRAPFPVYNFNPTWNKGTALLWTLGEELGLPVELPDGAIRPYGRIPYERKRKAWKALKEFGVGNSPFLVYDIPTHEEAIPVLAVLDHFLPEYRKVDILTIEEVVGSPSDNLVDFISVMSHPNLGWMVGNSLFPAYAAWAGGVPYSIQLYAGKFAHWDGARGEKNYTIQRDRVPEGQLHQAMVQGLEYLLEMDR